MEKIIKLHIILKLREKGAYKGKPNRALTRNTIENTEHIVSAERNSQSKIIIFSKERFKILWRNTFHDKYELKQFRTMRSALYKIKY